MNITASLKLKRGEIEGIVQSEREVRNALTPLFDVARPSSKKTTDQRLAESVELIRRGWPKISKEFFLDLRDLALEARLQSGMHPVYGLARQLALHGHRAIHCFGFDRDEAYEQAFASVVTENLATGIALRLDLHDLKLLDATEELSRGLLGRINRQFADLTVFLDLRSIHKSTDDLGAIVERAYQRFQRLGVVRFVLLASSMWDQSLIKTDRVTTIPRDEFVLWEQLRRRGLNIGYGDYGVIAPSYVDPEQKSGRGTPKFRYSTPSSWLVSKGEQIRKDEHSQYPRLAKRIMNCEQFRRNDLGWGHDQIRSFASYEYVAADHARAVAIDTCTHLDVTLKQVRFAESQILATRGTLP